MASQRAQVYTGHIQQEQRSLTSKQNHLPPTNHYCSIYPDAKGVTEHKFLNTIDSVSSNIVSYEIFNNLQVTGLKNSFSEVSIDHKTYQTLTI